MKAAQDLIPWQVTDISLRPYEGYWSFNPSIHFDGSVWRCVLRCCDYAMPDGVTIRSKTARSTGQQTKNAMVIFDPVSWAPIQIYKMHERDTFPRVATPHVGYEDMRLFRTDTGGLQGIAASLHLQRDKRSSGSNNQPPEQVLLSFDGEYNIVDAKPIRGDGWSGTPQKNWVPFDHCAEPRFLYSIGKGRLFDEKGSLHGDAAMVRLSTSTHPLGMPAVYQSSPEVSPSVVNQPQPEVLSQDRREKEKRPDLRTKIRGGDVQIVRGGRIMLDATASRPSRPSSHPSVHPLRRATAARSGDESTRMMGAGRMLVPKYNGLRGGTQLVHVSKDAWLGIGHEMKFVSGKKLYWHTWYLVDASGKMTHTSAPMKLVSNGIEFAAGMAIDGDRVVVSFGVDDMECKIGETKLSAVMDQLRAIAR